MLKGTLESTPVFTEEGLGGQGTENIYQAPTVCLYLSSTYCVPGPASSTVCIKSGDPHTIHVKWALLISIFQRRKLRSREVPKDTEQETEVLRVGFWKEGATQSPELKGKRGNVGGNGLRV